MKASHKKAKKQTTKSTAKRKASWISKHKTLANLPNNARFYVLLFSFGLSVLIASWLRLQIPGDQLFYIRTQQVFGFVSLFYWYLALLASPLSKVVSKEGKMKYWLFARRAIGVSAFYFALLHAAVAFWGQIGGMRGFGLLPERFQWSLSFGAAGVFVLLLMAATSFDKVIAFMTFRRWKWLHRVGYIAGVLTLLHVWMIATHVVYFGVWITLYAMLVLLLGLEAVRIAGVLSKKHKALRDKEALVMVAIWTVGTVLLLAVPHLIKNYHQERHGGANSAGHGSE